MHRAVVGRNALDDSSKLAGKGELAAFDTPSGNGQPPPVRGGFQRGYQGPDTINRAECGGLPLMIGVRRKAVDELRIVEIMNSLQDHRRGSGDDHQGKARIKRVRLVVDPREVPPYLVGL
jgi:hypothetical protein